MLDDEKLRTCFTWNKRGNDKTFENRKVRQLQDAIRERNIHGRKPQLIRDKIVEMFGSELPKIELFARVKADGWDIWGNELENDVELKRLLTMAGNNCIYAT